MNRTKIENVLMDMGVPAGIKGFDCIADAVEYIHEHGTNISVTRQLYPEIAKKRNTKPKRVERAIGHAFEVARSEKGDYEVVEKYIGFLDCSNFHSIVRLYKKIMQDSDETNTEPTKTITASEIRGIIRQELRIVLNELMCTAI